MSDPSSPPMRNDRPFVLKGAIEQWGARKWTPEILAQLVGEKSLNARFGDRKHKRGRILWETESPHRDLTVAEFLQWATATSDEDFAKPLEFDPHQFWGYLDYKYMFELFDESADLAQVDWSTLGIDRDGTDSSLWLGTGGAYTPCHYDTYGFNLHAQLYGTKRWVLFSPQDNATLKPTRLPYEESSVFSALDVVSAPSSLQDDATPYMVTVEPGDVLYLPPKWWHLAQCMEMSLSVNTWVPLEEDDLARVQESLCRSLVSLMDETGFIPAERGILPSETSLDLGDCLELLNEVVRKRRRCLIQQSAKRQKMDEEAPTTTDALEDEDFLNYHQEFLTNFAESGIPVPEVGYEDLKKALRGGPLEMSEQETKQDANNVGIMEIANGILHPDAIALISEIIVQSTIK